MTPEHLLHGVLADLEVPYGTQLGRRGRKHLDQLGWTLGPVDPASALLQADDVDTTGLRSQVDRMSCSRPGHARHTTYPEHRARRWLQATGQTRLHVP